MLTKPVRLSPGDIVTRSDLVIEYGGSVQSGGIVPSDTSNTVFIFSDPSEATNFGYVYDGFSDDGSILFYTGAGKVGDQQESRNNSSILTHAAKGRTLHAFIAVGVVPGTQTQRQKYIGEFILDPALPYERMPAPDRNGALRTVLVFRLCPVHPVSDDLIEVVGVSGITAVPHALPVPVEFNSTHFFETAGRPDQMAIRRESTLVDAFMASRAGHEFSRWAITLPAEHTRLLTDVYDVGTRTLYEAKALSGRSDVRMALGQLYDYRRHIDVDDLSCAVLLPERPTADLRDLLVASGLGLTFRDGDSFKVEQPRHGMRPLSPSLGIN